MDHDAISKFFRTEPHTRQQADVSLIIRRSFESLAKVIDSSISDGRHKSIAMTHLEDACMHVIKGLTE